MKGDGWLKWLRTKTKASLHILKWPPQYCIDKVFIAWSEVLCSGNQHYQTLPCLSNPSRIVSSVLGSHVSWFPPVSPHSPQGCQFPTVNPLIFYNGCPPHTNSWVYQSTWILLLYIIWPLDVVLIVICNPPVTAGEQLNPRPNTFGHFQKFQHRLILSFWFLIGDVTFPFPTLQCFLKDLLHAKAIIH